MSGVWLPWPGKSRVMELTRHTLVRARVDSGSAALRTPRPGGSSGARWGVLPSPPMTTSVPVATEATTHPVAQVLRERARSGSRPGAREDGHRVALVLEGGGMRGVVSAGMTAALERLGLTPCFDLVVGASAGAINGAALLAGAAERAVGAYTGPLASRSFVNPFRMLRGRPVIDVNDILELATGLESAGHARITDGDVALLCVAVDVESAATVTLRGMRTEREVWDALLASSRMPWAGGPPVALGGRRYLDGGMGSPVPVAEALEAGATHVLVLQTRPHGDPAQEHLEGRRPPDRAPPAGAQPGARRALPRADRRVRDDRGRHRATLGRRRGRRRRTCSACGRPPGRRASASSSGTPPCWPPRPRTRTGWSRPRSAASPDQSLVGLRSMPSLKRRSTFFSGVSGSSSSPSLKRPLRPPSGGSSPIPRAKLDSRSSAGVSGPCSDPVSKPPSPGCSGEAGCSETAGSAGAVRCWSAVSGRSGAPSRSGVARRAPVVGSSCRSIPTGYPEDRGGTQTGTSPSARAHAIVRRNVSSSGV